jgi:hypothetical protein
MDTGEAHRTRTCGTPPEQTDRADPPERCSKVDVDTIRIPCLTEGCEGEIHAARELDEDGTRWRIIWFEGVPVVLCSRGCRRPEDLVCLIDPEVRAA